MAAQPEPSYKTKLKEWKADLEAELRRKITWREIAEGSGVVYSTLQKHVNHEFQRPDYATASKISAWFNSMSKAKRKWTPLDYFFLVSSEEDDPGQREPALEGISLGQAGPGR
jgi:hypothetical protein